MQRLYESLGPAKIVNRTVLGLNPSWQGDVWQYRSEQPNNPVETLHATSLQGYWASQKTLELYWCVS